MTNEVLVDMNTKWKCVGCGKCCHNLGDETSEKLFGEKTGDNGKCVKLNEGRCQIYDQRPLGCKMYPFYPDWNELKQGRVNFKKGFLKIDADCPGYGQGDLVLKNKRTLKKLDKVAIQLKKNMSENKEGKIKDLFNVW